MPFTRWHELRRSQIEQINHVPEQMNFFKPLAAHDFPAFDIIPNAVSSAAVAPIFDDIIPRLPSAQPKQSGRVLTSVPQLGVHLAQLTDTISRKFGRRMFLRLDKSSYRVQPPDPTTALALHQDCVALQELVLKPFRRSTYRHTDPAKESCCTVWVPLVDIGEFTPTLEVCPCLPPEGFIPHAPDGAGYLILADDTGYKRWPMVSFTQLGAGTGVFLTSLTLHRSCVRPWHTRTRTSFDLRFLPRRQS